MLVLCLKSSLPVSFVTLVLCSLLCSMDLLCIHLPKLQYFRVILFGVHWIFLNYRFMLFVKSRKFSTIISLSAFIRLSCLLSPLSSTPMTYKCWTLCYSPTGPSHSVSFLFLFVLFFTQAHAYVHIYVLIMSELFRLGIFYLLDL